MKAAIYNPYLDTLGGGERYTITLAKILAEEGYDVDIEWKNKTILSKLSKRFGLKLPKNIDIVDSINRGENYDMCFWVSDGSIPTLRSKKNFLHFQIPFQNVNGRSLLNRMKLFRISKIICNSGFTKKVIDKEYGVDSRVLYPPVETNFFKPKRKVNQICYVGRFSNLTQNKGHEILIGQFKKLIKNNEFFGWKLILAGGTEVGADLYLKKLKKLIGAFNIEIIESPSVETIKNIYGQSKIFWSGAGYGADEIKNPDKVEHFGITLVEAMSAGCVPIVYNAGGHKEIIKDNVNGHMWLNGKELIEKTKMLVTKKGELTSLSKTAIQSSKRFNYEVFKNTIQVYLNSKKT